MYMKATLYMDVLPNLLDITDTGGRDDAFAPRCSGMLWKSIMVICQVLGVTPEWLLSGIEKNGSRKSKSDWYVVGKDTELGHLINAYNNMSRERRSRLIGYVEAIISLDF